MDIPLVAGGGDTDTQPAKGSDVHWGACAAVQMRLGDTGDEGAVLVLPEAHGVRFAAGGGSVADVGVVDAAVVVDERVDADGDVVAAGGVAIERAGSAGGVGA